MDSRGDVYSSSGGNWRAGPTSSSSFRGSLGIGVGVGGAVVGVGGTAVAVGGTVVAVGGTRVAVGGKVVAVDCTRVGTAVDVEVG